MKNPFEITQLKSSIVCSNCGGEAEIHPLNPNSETDHFHNGVYCTKSKFDVVNDYVSILEAALEDNSGVYVEPEEDCPMDGDAQSALASCGWGDDEDYGCFDSGDY